MATREEQRFGRVGKAIDKMSRPLSRYVDKLWHRWIAPSAGVSQDWLEDADWAKVQQEPVRARGLLYVMLLVILALITWASFAELDEVARGEGTVIPSKQTQIVQSYDGGVVQKILVREGEVVDQGALLMQIDPTRYISSYRENRVQYLSLLARAARLEALAKGESLVIPSAVSEQEPALADNETTLYYSNLEELKQQVSRAEQQLLQREEELQEVNAKLKQVTRAAELSSQELKVTKPLLGSGAISEVEILRLERDLANAEGERDQAIAQRERIMSAIIEAQNKIEEVTLAAQNEWRSQLSETLASLSSLSETGLGLADRVKYADIRAPVHGTVQRLFINTEGGVVQPGSEVVEMTPLDDQLLIEAKISPKDIAFVRPGQKAMVKFTAYDFTVYGGLSGELEHISADTITDKENDQTYYLVRVRTERAGFDKAMPIIPGMTAQIDIITGKKTVMSYLLKPILRAKQNALTER
ncbi:MULTISPECIES: HlyD family type I secretion periplasmic adaptor subunit [unclassified Gilvimarinus]|uniref:HlyD family type I secretion periplasmic adaptor subunit n=1 Tax=unclassified Gilvimarinus TaxID=2642066 RepID=UPI0026E22E27|nr:MULTISPECIES: HlyD family type I secretion periplasmic adaptor subunit [unclassified Gilvimarinus]MDO6571498.1 HlyD family type I secretion periplasmic adaptor subunit [Gilvimarinus sp. 2_MG-2023]MDO6747321.1 HlyD family type I secretion periplasmic adaptor subunit [Gilvimarinus sp. 1_MG-2023]